MSDHIVQLPTPPLSSEQSGSGQDESNNQKEQLANQINQPLTQNESENEPANNLMSQPANQNDLEASIDQFKKECEAKRLKLRSEKIDVADLTDILDEMIEAILLQLKTQTPLRSTSTAVQRGTTTVTKPKRTVEEQENQGDNPPPNQAEETPDLCEIFGRLKPLKVCQLMSPHYLLKIEDNKLLAKRVDLLCKFLCLQYKRPSDVLDIFQAELYDVCGIRLITLDETEVGLTLASNPTKKRKLDEQEDNVDGWMHVVAGPFI
ncbi:unnamed protein product [Orchesella dallaii]|uniref:Uncharacterized protein n=1 Tax=Orchesella dallaii TaxID=48710 RepID=A0ABP1RMU6_9HEXA